MHWWIKLRNEWQNRTWIKKERTLTEALNVSETPTLAPRGLGQPAGLWVNIFTEESPGRESETGSQSLSSITWSSCHLHPRVSPCQFKLKSLTILPLPASVSPYALIHTLLSSAAGGVNYESLSQTLSRCLPGEERRRPLSQALHVISRCYQ